MKKLFALSCILGSIALAGCSSTTLNPPSQSQNSPQSQNTVSVNPDVAPVSFNNGLYNVTLSISKSWNFDTSTFTFTKENEKIIFDPDWSPGTPENASSQESDLTTNDGKILHVTVTADKNNPSSGALVHVQDRSTENGTFNFSYVSPNVMPSSEFYDIAKTVTWKASSGT